MHLRLWVNAGNRCHSIHPAMQQYLHPAWMSAATFGSTKPSRDFETHLSSEENPIPVAALYLAQKSYELYKTSLDILMIFLALGLL